MILGVASWLVPAAQRADWLAEWRSELWHVRRSCSRASAAMFAIGAFRDALWLRRNAPAPSKRVFSPASPLLCLAILAASATVTYIGAQRLSSDGVRRGLLTISAGRHHPEIPYHAYRSIADHSWRPFSAIAFYQPIRAGGLSVALATPSLAAVIGIPLRSDGPSIYLSPRISRLWFASDPAVTGRIVEIAGRHARVAGVMPSNASPLAVHIDVWLIDDAQPAEDARGFVLALAKTPSAPGRHWSIVAPSLHNGWDRFECISLDQHPPLLSAVLMMSLALLLLPLCTTVQLGEYPATAHSPRGFMRLRRWCFLAVKLALLVPSVFWGTQIFAALAPPDLQPHGLLIGFLATFRWAIVDQRRRCPVCLRVLTNPIAIGSASQTFLEWYGAELICSKGHGLLHVPEIESSYTGSRWLYLDASWTSLFS
jgi:hypothetical protein